MTASASLPPNFTFLSLPVRHSEPRSPARRWREHSRPDNLTFSSLTLSDAYPSDTVSIVLPSGISESLPARQTHLLHPVAGETYPSRLIFRRTPARASRPDNLTFSSPMLVTLIRPTQWVLCSRRVSVRASQPDDLPIHPTVGETDPFDSGPYADSVNYPTAGSSDPPGQGLNHAASPSAGRAHPSQCDEHTPLSFGSSPP
ncbi:hypothetical protein G5714_006884 [Onychostoma macrolepis]|uniref:Uncharacterized protein n=1 Tax=Onychostoma macrolepis TaxID=369639 RepID=A0A7J6CXN0_9TELE|nr:hypothetical protein G5714_006884 [Onychostoma macrolepis]